MTTFWQNDNIVWSEGIKEMHLVIKDDHNMHAHKLPNPEKFFPTKVRMTLIQVSKEPLHVTRSWCRVCHRRLRKSRFPSSLHP